MLIQHKFDYKPLERFAAPDGRRYIVGDEYLPSVTTILSDTQDMTHLDQWKKNVGEAEANRIRDEAANLGTGMHQNLENYIFGKPLTGTFMEKALAKVIIKNGLCNVDEVWGSEVALYCKGMYAGTTDNVGLWNGKPSIIDFKNSLKPKRLEWIDSYRAQIAAYSMAHDEMFGTNIRCGVIMIATRDAKYQEFVFEGAEFDKCVDLWLSKLSEYYSKPGR